MATVQEKAPDPTYDQSVVVEWLNTGCPVCHDPITTDFPVYQPHKPGVYPALLFHYAVKHEGVTPPPAPHPDDEACLNDLIVVGTEMVGNVPTPRKVPYRQLIADAAKLWNRGIR
jgi:hypothetical protein